MADLDNDVLSDAIASAVRRAMDDVGRAPYGELSEAPAQAPAPAAAPTILPADLGKLCAAADIDRGPLRPPPDVDDPYAVLGVPRGATWERITAAHRRLARAWHPDGAPDEEGAMREDLIRRLNVAYAELRVRRGR